MKYTIKLITDGTYGDYVQLRSNIGTFINEIDGGYMNPFRMFMPVKWQVVLARKSVIRQYHRKLEHLKAIIKTKKELGV